MRTPKQVAEDTLRGRIFDLGPLGYELVRDLIAAAIEADRAQRDEPEPVAGPEDRVRAYLDARAAASWLGDHIDGRNEYGSEMRWTHELTASDIRDVLNELDAWRERAETLEGSG